MKKILFILAAVFLIAGQGSAGDAKKTRAAADKLLTLFNMDVSYEKSMEQAVEMTLGIIDSQDLPEQEKREAKKAAETGMKIAMKKFTYDKMKGMFVDIYAEVFTVEELEGMIAFYESPIGRKFIKKQPQLTAATMQKMKVLMQEIIPEIQEEVNKVMANKKQEKSDAGAGK